MLRASAALLFVAGSTASDVAVECLNGDCRSSLDEEDAALLQVQGKRDGRPYTNPCSGNSEPKDSVESYCKDAGFKFVGDADSYEWTPGTENCCVPSTWTCDMGTEEDCKHKGIAKPAFLGVTSTNHLGWSEGGPQGNCCLPPNPDTSNSATWTMDTQGSPSEKECKSNEKAGKGNHIVGFWTGSRCVMTCEDSNGKYSPATCKKGKNAKGSDSAEESGMDCSC